MSSLSLWRDLSEFFVGVGILGAVVAVIAVALAIIAFAMGFIETGILTAVWLSATLLSLSAIFGGQWTPLFVSLGAALVVLAASVVIQVLRLLSTITRVVFAAASRTRQRADLLLSEPGVTDAEELAAA